MGIYDTIPPSYKPLSPETTESRSKYRWPAFPPRQLRDTRTKSNLFVDGPLQSPPPAPRLRIHRQTSYTDAYSNGKPPEMHKHSPKKSEWVDPVGKYGEFCGETSVYEDDYSWPDGWPSKYDTPRIPLKSTIGYGILPILGTTGDQKATSATSQREEACKEKLEKDDKKKDDLLKKKYKRSICEDFVPLQDLWAGETTYKRDYLIPPKGWRTESVKRPEQELKTSKDAMETSTTVMRDYQDRRDWVCEEDLKVKPRSQKGDSQSRFPFFLF